MLENFATDWKKRDRSVVFNTLFVVFLKIGATFAFLVLGKCLLSNKI